MKSFALLFFLSSIVAPMAAACSDFSGHYRFSEAPWNGTIRIEQKGCATIAVYHTRKVVVLRQNLKLDGQAYVGIESSSQRANLNSTWYQKVSVEDNRLVFRQYSGSKKICGDKYSFNKSECHLITYSLSQATGSEDFAWVQKGVWWTEGGESLSVRYILNRTNGLSISMVAQN